GRCGGDPRVQPAEERPVLPGRLRDPGPDGRLPPPSPGRVSINGGRGPMRWSWGICVAAVLVACHAAPSPSPASEPLSTTQPVGVTEPRSRVLSGDVHLPDGFTVPPGETWVFDHDTDTTVTASANVIVETTMVMRPASGDIEQ